MTTSTYANIESTHAQTFSMYEEAAILHTSFGSASTAETMDTASNNALPQTSDVRSVLAFVEQ